MNFETIKKNLVSLFAQLMALRMIVTSPSEKVADLPTLYVVIVVLLAPWICVSALILGFLFKYAVRFEKE
ncbi:MAG: hypothetical protein J6K32_07405 [Clostridia bacterium]|nr:hypothetical protein [Clostridia bacterium]